MAAASSVHQPSAAYSILRHLPSTLLGPRVSSIIPEENHIPLNPWNFRPSNFGPSD